MDVRISFSPMVTQDLETTILEHLSSSPKCVLTQRRLPCSGIFQGFPRVNTFALTQTTRKITVD